MTGGTIAGIVISEQILGMPCPWKKVRPAHTVQHMLRNPYTGTVISGSRYPIKGDNRVTTGQFGGRSFHRCHSTAQRLD